MSQQKALYSEIYHLALFRNASVPFKSTIISVARVLCTRLWL